MEAKLYEKLFNEENIFAYLTGLIFLSLYFVNLKFIFDIGVKITFADIAIFGILLFFLLGNLKIGILNLTNNIKISAYILLIVYMIFMMGFSIFFNPYIYFIIGLLWVNSYKDEYLEIKDGKFYGK
jgi:hypothetical protein